MTLTGPDLSMNHEALAVWNVGPYSAMEVFGS